MILNMILKDFERSDHHVYHFLLNAVKKFFIFLLSFFILYISIIITTKTNKWTFCYKKTGEKLSTAYK